MKREEKNMLSRQKIIDGAMTEFSKNGYDGASLNAVCSEYGISKGIIYHYFKDKDDVYMQCVAICFDELTMYLKQQINNFVGSPEEKIRLYFDARLHFFARNPIYLGIFGNVTKFPPQHLISQINQCKSEFDQLNILILTEFLKQKPLRKGLSIDVIVEDFRVYMDYFNMRFKKEFDEHLSLDVLIKNHEERCHRQLDILLYGVIGEKR